MKTAEEILSGNMYYLSNAKVVNYDAALYSMEEYADQYKNQSQPIEKEEMLTMAADAYKDLLSRYKELEAQLKEYKEGVEQIMVHLSDTEAAYSPEEAEEMIEKAMKVGKSLESSPTEQPEAQPYECDHKGNLDACGNERCWDLQECQDSRYPPEQQNQPQPEKAQEEQSEREKELLKQIANLEDIVEQRAFEVEQTLQKMNKAESLLEDIFYDRIPQDKIKQRIDDRLNLPF